MPMHSPGVLIVLATEVANGEPGADAQAWLADGFRRWLASDRAMGVERFLGLPPSPAKARRLLRDFWLASAAKHLGSRGTPHERSTRLLSALSRLACGLPSGESKSVEEALRQALAADAEMPTTVPGITRITG